MDNKFIVPCNPEEYLSFQYGKDKWRNPMKEKYFNYNAIGFLKFWTDKEWPHAVRWYDIRTGKLNFHKTLSTINQYLEIPIKTLPEDSLK